MDNFTPQGKDPVLWDLARRRASFKSHLLTYIIINAFLWALWFFSDYNDNDGSRFPWALWPTLGWGVGLAFHYIGAYVTPRSNSIDREYDKLIQKQNKQS
jgi:hypothetical protein